MITKNELVIDALEQLKISGLTVSASPSEITSAIRRMDSMIAAWQNQGLCLSYNKSAGYSSIDPLQNSGISESDALAVVLNLAKTLSPSYGKQPDLMTINEAKTAYEGLFSVELISREPDTFQPVGAGNLIWGVSTEFNFQSPEPEAPIDCSVNDMVVGETGVVTTDFESYLLEVDGDTIASYTTDDSEGVKLLGDSLSGSIVTMDVEASIIGFGQIIVTVTTSSGRILPRAVKFNVKAV